MNIVSFDDNELVMKAKSGDSASLQSLIERYSDKILQKAKSFKSLAGLENDDLYQEGMLGFVSAVYTFDESKGILFSAYAATLSVRKMLSALRKANNSSNLPLRSYISIEDEVDLLSDAPTPEDLMLFSEELNEITDFVENSFSKKEKKVFKLNILGLTYFEISEILDCSEKSVDNTMQRIRRKIREFKCR